MASAVALSPILKSADSTSRAEPTPNLTYGTARWSDDLDGALIMHLTRGNIGGEEYVLQVQVTNPAVPQNSVAVSIESNGIEIARVAERAS